MSATDISRHDHLGDAAQAIEQRVRRQALRCGSNLTLDHQACASDEFGTEARDLAEQAEEASNPSPAARQHAFPRRGRRPRECKEETNHLPSCFRGPRTHRDRSSLGL
jgi:hypothetical protein